MSEFDPVSKGVAFEYAVIELLNKYGFNAVRTNKTNKYDPIEYRHGFDGGVDVIATFTYHGVIDKEYTFFIQCKCQERELTKTAISEVYSGTAVRNKHYKNIIPVVFATSDASAETIQYARSLHVELFLNAQYKLIHDLTAHKISVPYGNYGIFFKCLLYGITKDSIWMDTIPETRGQLNGVSETEKYLEASKVDFDKAQAFLNEALSQERKANENRQKAMDIQKVAVYRSLVVSKNCQNCSKHKRESISQGLTKDSG